MLMRIKRLSALAFLLSAGCTHAVDTPPPHALKGGSPLKQLAACRLCLSPFLEPSGPLYTITVHSFSLIPSAGAYVADALEAELRRTGHDVMRVALEDRVACTRMPQVHGAVEKFLIQSYQEGVLGSRFALINETNITLRDCSDSVALSKTYRGTVSPLKVSIGDAPPGPGWVATVIKEMAPLSVRSLVKEITFDPDFVNALQSAAATCGNGKSG